MSANIRIALVLVAAVSASGLSASGQQLVTEAVTVTPRAPVLSGLGALHLPVAAKDARAQAFFDQGLRLLYAFNHAEARRAFQEAARLDGELAMAHWGEAMTLAVNLNAPMSAESGRVAYESVERAQALAHKASPKERALIAALAMRFAADGTAPRPPLDRAYADAMTKAAETFVTDPDVQTLYADAVMNTIAWDYWQKDGTLKPEAEPVRRALERAIGAHPDHAGAHHYYVHLMEGSRTPEAAEASADRLAGLMPAAGHIVHMPAHIYLRVGRYADAAEANVRAIAADEDYLAQCQAQGLYPVSYYPHNLHFLWAAATFEGRSAVAIDAARQVAAKGTASSRGRAGVDGGLSGHAVVGLRAIRALARDVDRAQAARDRAVRDGHLALRTRRGLCRARRGHACRGRAGRAHDAAGSRSLSDHAQGPAAADQLADRESHRTRRAGFASGTPRRGGATPR